MFTTSGIGYVLKNQWDGFLLVECSRVLNSRLSSKLKFRVQSSKPAVKGYVYEP
jgi:hypothetical protein